MKKIIDFFKMLFGFLIMAILFLIGITDRIILLPLFWVESPNLTSSDFYRAGVGFSFIRVIATGLIVSIYFLIKWIF